MWDSTSAFYETSLLLFMSQVSRRYFPGGCEDKFNWLLIDVGFSQRIMVVEERLNAHGKKKKSQCVTPLLVTAKIWPKFLSVSCNLAGYWLQSRFHMDVNHMLSEEKNTKRQNITEKYFIIGIKPIKLVRFFFFSFLSWSDKTLSFINYCILVSQHDHSLLDMVCVCFIVMLDGTPIQYYIYFFFWVFKV